MSRCCCKQKKTTTARNSITSQSTKMQQNEANRATMQQARPTGQVYEPNPAMQSYAQPGAPTPYQARPTYQSSYAAQGQPMRQTYEEPMNGSVTPAYTQQSMPGSQATYSPRNSAIPLPADYIQQQQQQQSNCPCPKKTTYTIKIPSRRKAANSMACETLVLPQNNQCSPCETLLIPQTALAASSARPCETVLIPESSSSPSKNLRTLVFRLPVPAANQNNGDNDKKGNSDATDDDDADVKTTRKVKKSSKRRSSTRKDNSGSESDEDEKSTKKKDKSKKKSDKRGSKSEGKRKSTTDDTKKKSKKSRSKSSDSSDSDEDDSDDVEFIARPPTEMCCCLNNQTAGCCCSAPPPKCCVNNQNDDFKSCTCPQQTNNGNSCYVHNEQQRPSGAYGEYMDRNRMGSYDNGQQVSLFKRPPGCTCTDQDLIEGILGSQRKTQCFVHRSKSTAYMEPNRMRQYDIFQQNSDMLDERRASNANRASAQFRRSNDFGMSFSKSAGQVDRSSWGGIENDEPLDTDLRCTCQEELMKRKCEAERKKMCSCIYKKQKLKEICPDVALDDIVFNCNCAKVAKKEAKKKAEAKKCKAMKACCAKKKGADSDLDSDCCCQPKKKAKKEKKRCCDEIKKKFNCDQDSDSDSDSSCDCIEEQIAKRKAKYCKLLKEKKKAKCEQLKKYCCDEKKKNKVECVFDSDCESDSTSCATELKSCECKPQLKKEKEKKEKQLEKRIDKIKECYCDEKAMKRAIKERKKAEKKAEKEAKKEAKRKEKYCKELAKYACAQEYDSCCSFEYKNHMRNSKSRSSRRSNKDQFCCGDKQVCCKQNRSESPSHYCKASDCCSDEEYFSAHSQRSKCDHRRRDERNRRSNCNHERSHSCARSQSEKRRQSCCEESRSKCNHRRSDSCARSRSEKQRQSCCEESRSNCNHGRSNSCARSQSEKRRQSCCEESRSKCNHRRSNSCSRSRSEKQRESCCGDSILESELQDSCSQLGVDPKRTKSKLSIKEAKVCCKFDNKLCKIKCKKQLENCKSSLIGVADPKKQKALLKLEKNICMIRCKDQLKSCKAMAKSKYTDTPNDSPNKKSGSSSTKKQSGVRSTSKERNQTVKSEACCCPVQNEPKSSCQSSKSLSKGCPVGKSRSQKSHLQKSRSKSPSISKSKESCCCRPSQRKSGRMHAGEIENDDTFFLKIKDLIFKHKEQIEAQGPLSTKKSFFKNSDEKLQVMPPLKNESYKPHIICESSIQTDNIDFSTPHAMNNKEKLLNYELSDQSTKTKKKERFSFNPKNLLKIMKPKSESKTMKEDLKLLKTKEKLQSWLEPTKNAVSRIDYHSPQVLKTKRENNELKSQVPKTTTKEILPTGRTNDAAENNKQIKNEHVTSKLVVDKPRTVITELTEEKYKKTIDGSNGVSSRSRHTRELHTAENKNDGTGNAEKPMKIVMQRVEESDTERTSSKKDDIEIIKQRREAPKPISTRIVNIDNEEKPIKIKQDEHQIKIIKQRVEEPLPISTKKYKIDDEENPIKKIKQREEEPLPISTKKDKIDDEEKPIKKIKHREEEPQPIFTKKDKIEDEEKPIKIKKDLSLTEKKDENPIKKVKQRQEEPMPISTKKDSIENAKYPMEKIKHRVELTENPHKIIHPRVENYSSERKPEESDSNKTENTPGHSKRDTPKELLDGENTNPHNKEIRDTGGENSMYTKNKKDVPNNINNYFKINKIRQNFKTETDRIEDHKNDHRSTIVLMLSKSELTKNSNVHGSNEKGEKSKSEIYKNQEKVNDKERKPFVLNPITFKDDDKRFLIEKFLQSSFDQTYQTKSIEKEFPKPLEKSIEQKIDDRDKYQQELPKELVSSCSRKNKTKPKSLSNGHEKMIPKHIKIKRKSLGLRKIKRLESETEEIPTSRKTVRKLKKIKTKLSTKYNSEHIENSALENIQNLAIKSKTGTMSKVKTKSHHFS